MEKIKITKYEQNCITIEIGDTEYYVIDTGSETSMDKLLSIKKATGTFVSHSHPDHFNINNLKTLNCPIYGSKEVFEELKKENIDSKELIIDNKVILGSLQIRPFILDHGIISAPIVNLGFHINTKEKSILYLGDIANSSTLPTDSKYDLIFIPVGGSKVFDIHKALDFIKYMNYKGIVIPMHYHGRADRSSGNNFKNIASPFCKPIVLDVGESIII